ncbi:MAG: hypothetical protein IPM79_25565 [Polyangiaceae bacterium]|nr:hypothetical protein [Polyangiaceae bacterium]MBK8940894.1 hypothetical protein [Polyangiaceae bacterium]
MSPRLISLLAVALASACADGSGLDDPSGGAGGGDGGSTGPGPSVTGAGGHGCFDTETLCAGACVDVSSHPDHCGQCDNPCAGDGTSLGECVEGACINGCAAGFVDDNGTCKNFLGAYEAWPAECAGCANANPYSSACGCPASTSPLPLHVQSDCPGVPMRFKTTLDLCVTSGVAESSDFGGAYEVDDFDGWCGATAQCRVGNPMAGNTCACPAGFDDVIALRSIIRLPCDNAEAGNTIFLCGNMDAPFTSFAGAYQFDDFAPNCRVANPWTGDCSCPAGSTDRVYRVMVDGGAGLYGSTIHLCTP